MDRPQGGDRHETDLRPAPHGNPCGGGICASRKGLPGPCSWLCRVERKQTRKGRASRGAILSRGRRPVNAVEVWPPAGGTGGNDGSQPGEAEAFASSGGGRLRVEPPSRPGCGYLGGVSGPIAYSRLLELGRLR